MVNYLKTHKWKILAGASVIGACILIAQETYPALILAYIMIYGIGTTGLDILFGYSGQISMGHAGLFAVGSYTSALLSVRCGVTPVLGILAGSVLATLTGLLIAVPASKLVKHFLSLMTIAFGQIVYMFVNACQPLTNGATGISSIPYISLFGFRLDTYYRCFFAYMILLILVLIAKARIIRSRVGRALIAIRENTVAAEGIGINIRAYKAMAFGISAFMMGLAGGLYAHMVTYISPETYNATQSTLFMTMVLFGGIGTTMGPVVGAAVLMFVKEVFQFLQIYQVLIYGVFILIVLFFFPNGMVGLYADMKKRILKARRRGDGHAPA